MFDQVRVNTSPQQPNVGNRTEFFANLLSTDASRLVPQDRPATLGEPQAAGLSTLVRVYQTSRTVDLRMRQPLHSGGFAGRLMPTAIPKPPSSSSQQSTSAA